MSPSQLTHGMRLRILIVSALLLCGLLVMVAKAARLQLGLGHDLLELAEQQYVRSLRFSAPRGNVYDREGRPLAISVPVWSVSASPRTIADASIAATALAPLLNIEYDRIETKLSTERAFVWLKRRIAPALAEKVRALKLDGVALHRESKRFYPGRELAGQTLGTVSIDGAGQSGVEHAYDKHLRGRSISLPGIQDNRGRRMLLSGAVDLEVLGGDDVYLTLDARLQHLVERALRTGIERTKAKSGMAVVADPATGALLAIANAPFFNPNRPGKASAVARRNHVFSDIFEPGSTFKVISFAAALDADVIKPADRIFCENGRYKLGRHVIHDTHPEGWLSARDVFKYSSNIGTLKIARRLGEQGFRDALDRFGFGKRPGLGFIEESRGLVVRKKRWGEARLATVSFGHGISVTALQLTQAMSIVANGGLKVPLRLLSRVESATGEIALEPEPTEGVRVIQEKTAKTVANIMASVFEKGGTGYHARLDGMKAAGKTGTAEKVDPQTGRYSKEAHTSSFVGFAPIDDPRFVVVVVLDEPQGRVSGEATAGPIWREILSAALIGDGAFASTPLPARKRALAVATRPIAQVGAEPAQALSGVTSGDAKVAEFLGLSAREAVREADARNLEVIFQGNSLFKGSGRVRRATLTIRDEGANLLHLELGRAP